MSPVTLVFVVSALLSLSLVSGENKEILLIRELLEGYPIEGGRPVANASDAVEVQLKLHLLDIHSLDQEKKIFTTTAWLMQQWTDSMLTWDPSEFGGIDYVLLDLMAIWRPDITLFNALDKPEVLQPVMAHVSSSGQVIIVEPYRYVTQCPDVTPEEKKPSCFLKFGSWAYDISRLKVSSLESRVDTSFFQINTEYELLGSKIDAAERTYPCCPDTKYGHVQFTIELEKRKKEPKVDPNASAATTSVAVATTTIALLALQMMLVTSR